MLRCNVGIHQVLDTVILVVLAQNLANGLTVVVVGRSGSSMSRTEVGGARLWEMETDGESTPPPGPGSSRHSP